MPKAKTKKKRPVAAAKKKTPKKVKKSVIKKLRGGSAAVSPMGWILPGPGPAYYHGYDYQLVSFRSFTPSFRSFSGGGGFGSNRSRSGRGTSN